MQDLGNKLAGCHVFSRLDLVKGYHQVPVADAYVPKIAIITLFGLYKYLYIPFGLKNAVQSFQQLMDNLLAEVPHIFIYLDDILLAPQTWLHIWLCSGKCLASWMLMVSP